MDPGTGLAAAARAALPKVRELIGASPDDNAEYKALGKAAGAVAVQLLAERGEPFTDEDTNHLSEILLMTLSRTDEVSLQRVASMSGFRAWLIEAFRMALQPLEQPNVGFRALRLDVSASRVAGRFVDALTENLWIWGGEKSSLLRDAAIVLYINRDEENRPPVADDAPPSPVVHAWITVETTPPEIVVYNAGDSPILEVVPTPALVALGLDGHQAMIGLSPLTGNAAQQISPGHGFKWPLEHMRSWGASPLVRSHLQLDFYDNAGRRWRLAHDHLTQL